MDSRFEFGGYGLYPVASPKTDSHLLPTAVGSSGVPISPPMAPAAVCHIDQSPLRFDDEKFLLAYMTPSPDMYESPKPTMVGGARAESSAAGRAGADWAGTCMTPAISANAATGTADKVKKRRDTRRPPMQ